MRLKYLLAACVGVAVLALPCAAAADSTAQARQEDLDYLVETLTAKHPDFYANTTEQAVADKRAAIEAGLAGMSDLDFAIALSELTAMAGDSHTMLSVASAIEEPHMIPFVPQRFDRKWRLAGTTAENKAYLGWEITAVNGHPLDEIEDTLAQMVSHDNAVFLRRQLGGMLYIAEVLQHYGVIPAEAETVPVTLRDDGGKEETVTLPVWSRDEYFAAGEEAFVTAAALRTAVPQTEPDNVYYKLLDLGNGTLYMQYNACREDPDCPMAGFAAEIKEKLESGAYAQFIIDLRNNGGGSDGVLYPVVYQAQQFMVRGGAAYVLAGEGTFSSALINAVQLKDIGAVVVGELTGGSVDHFGSVTGFTLPNSKIRGQYSNKFIDMAGYYEAARSYGVESLPPDIAVCQSFADYLNGVDTAVQYLLTHEPVKPAAQAGANVSQAHVVVDGRQAGIAAYEIAGSNYFKLRDLAMAFAGTKAAFNVTWDGQDRTVTLSSGAYTPVGGELAPLTGGSRTASRATADVYWDDMPLVGRAYEIDGNHYFKLRDLCLVVGVSVEWEEQTRTIRIDTNKPYIA